MGTVLVRTQAVSDPELYLFRPGLTAEQFFDWVFRPARDGGHRERVQAAWRLVRYHAWLRGMCREGSFLDDATRFEPDPWTHPVSSMPGAPILRMRGPVREMPRLPLLPPDVPPGDVEPIHDQALLEWVDWMRRLASHLQIDDGFLRPETVRSLFPPPEEMFAFEYVVLDELLEFFVMRGAGKALEHCRNRYDLSSPESISMVRALGPLASLRQDTDQTNVRALMVMRLDALYTRAVRRFDYRGAHAVLKTLSVVQGLASTDAIDTRDRDREETVREVAAGRDKIRASVTTPRIREASS